MTLPLVLEGCFETTNSVNIPALNLEKFWKDSLAE
jgi:hypothetical protein